MRILKGLNRYLVKKLKQLFLSIQSFINKIKRGSSNVIHDFRSGDLYVKLSLLFMSIGFFRRHQIIKGILFSILQIGFILFMIFTGIPNLSKYNTLGTIQFESVYNPITRRNEVNNYDHSFKILLYGLISIIVIFTYAYIHIKNIQTQRKLQLLEAEGHHINTFKEDLIQLKDDRFHVTLLTLPISGIIFFTIIPLLFMILVAFTNYDQLHMPPTKLFSWVGLRNFEILLTTGSNTVTFGYAFRKVLTWTLTWAFFATFLNYIGGIILALLINSKYTKLPKLWRTIFVITIAVPQFVSLLLVRHFFADQGIMNTLLSADIPFLNDYSWIDFIRQMGLIKANREFVPFLTDPVWSKVMLILINCWIGFPYVMLITTGVLMNIPKDLYESAEIDGANKFQLFAKITMPYMLFVTAPYLITNFVHNLNNFNVIYLLTSTRVTSNQLLANANASDTDLLVTWLFKLTQDYYNYKMASVIGIMMFLLSAVFTLMAFNYTIKSNKEDRFQ